jgi:hypothetical protein
MTSKKAHLRAQLNKIMAKKLKSKSPLDAAACSGFFIVNDFDRPDEERIAGKGPDGKFYYIHPSLRDVKLYHGMTPTNPTPLEDFGIRWMVDAGKFVGMLIDECRAAYRDGRPRKWQGVERFSFSIQNNQPSGH